MSNAIRLSLFILLTSSLVVGQSTLDKPEIPSEVRYKFASDEVNASARGMLEKALAGDKDNRLQILGGGLTCGPMLWQALRPIADRKLIDAKPITGIIATPTAITTEGRGFATADERQLFWSTLLKKYPALANARVRKAKAREISYFWATIPFDIEEPFFALDAGSDVFVAMFFNDKGKLSLFWIDLVGDLKSLKAETPKNETERLITEELSKDAETQSPEAMFRAGKAYLTGDGVPLNQEKGRALLDSAAQKGSLDAQLFLGSSYFSGKYLPQDRAKAAPYFTMAADKGNALAQFYVGMMYLYGTGLEKSPDKALPYLQKSAEQNFAGAQYNLGAMYFLGIGVAMDKARACTLYEKAADQGQLEAINDLGWCYQQGVGVEQDLTKAKALYTKAAERGHLRGQGNLAMMYISSGEWDKAYIWLRIAENAGASAQALPILEGVRKHLTQAQMDLAELKVTEWQKAHPRK